MHFLIFMIFFALFAYIFLHAHIDMVFAFQSLT